MFHLHIQELKLDHEQFRMYFRMLETHSRDASALSEKTAEQQLASWSN